MRAHFPGLRSAYLSCNVVVGFLVAINVVSVYVVRAWDTVQRPQNHARVVVGDDICITILRLVGVQVGILPGELVTRIDRLVLLREKSIVLSAQLHNVLGQVGRWDRSANNSI